MQSSLFRKILHPKKRAFLVAFSRCGQVGKSAELAEVDRNMHYHWLRDDPEYVEAFATARELAADLYEDEIVRRGVEGIIKPVYDKDGNQVGERREYSDTLLIFGAKGAKPEKYRENAGTTVHNQINLQVNVNFSSRLNAANQEAELVRGPERHSLPLQR